MIERQGSPSVEVDLLPRNVDAWISLRRSSAIVGSALVGGGLCGFAILRSGLMRDPSDVVGVPLLRGYSEAAEQWGLYTFVLAVISLTACLGMAARRSPASILVPVGLAVPLLLCLPSWCAWPERLPMVTLVAVLAFLTGWRWRRAGSRPSQVVAFLLWGVGFSYLPIALWGQGVFLLAGGLSLVAMIWLRRKLPTSSGGDRVGGLHWWAAILVVGGTSISTRQEFLLGSIGVLALLMGRWSRGGDSSRGAWAWPIFVAALAAILSSHDSWTELGPGRTVLMVASGAAGAVVVASALPSIRREAAAFRRWLPGLAVVALAAMNVHRPWFGLLIVGASLGLARWHPGRSWRGPMAGVLTAVLLLAIVPDPPSAGIDSFHDGQILSAVWEFETGKALYSEVFPLRGYEFFEAWLSRRVWGQSIGDYLVARQVLACLPVAGAFLLAYAWTRSLGWSFATALAAATYPAMGARASLPLLFAATGVGVLRSRRRRHLLWLAVGGWLAAFCGFDSLVPLVGGTVLTVLIAGPPGRPAASRVGWALLASLLLLAPFTAFIAAWQGPRAAGAYWWLLLDYARNYPSLYGLPLPWHDRGLAFLMASGLLVVGSWASVGALAWRHIPARWRRAWLFLLIDYLLLAQRGLGRSDAAHLGCLLLPNLALASIGLWELLGHLSRRGPRPLLADRRTVAFAGLIGSCWLIPGGRSTPLDFLGWVHTFPEKVMVPARSPLILERVGEDDTLWEMEGGMMNFLHRRHNPTRHALAYCICSPAEQRVAVEALRRRPPRLIAWRYMSGSNDIPNPMRFDVIARELYRRYQPVPGTSFLEPAPADWPGQVNLEPPFLGPLPLGRLGLRWGEDRGNHRHGRLEARKPIGPGSLSANGRVWEAGCRINSRVANFLSLDLTCHGAGDRSQLTLEFAPPGRGYDEESRVSFAAASDDVPHAYLLPVGCSPGWSFRPEIARIRITAPAGVPIAGVYCESWQVDTGPEEAPGR